MAKRRLRLTGFARFLIVMLFLAPIAYVGASYYNGEDGIENIKKLVGIESTQDTKSTAKNIEKTEKKTSNRSSSENVGDLEQLKRENAQLKRTVREQEQEIYKLKEEIINLKRSK